MIKQYSRLGFLLGIVFLVAGVQSVWANPISIDIQTGTSGGFGYSGIHAATNCNKNDLCMSGAKLYWPLTGTLYADQDATTFGLTNLHGTLTAGTGGSMMGSMEIIGGSLTANSEGHASGSFDYILTGDLQETGTFHFLAAQMCCGGAPNGGPNNLTDSGFTLWGNNWDVFAGQTKYDVDGTPLGIDLVGTDYQYTSTPEPSTMILLGSGLLTLPFFRKKRV